MRWDKELEYKLRELPLRVKALENLEDRISYLEETKYMVKPVNTDSVQAFG